MREEGLENLLHYILLLYDIMRTKETERGSDLTSLFEWMPELDVRGIVKDKTILQEIECCGEP